jgi:hypothetical protein
LNENNPETNARGWPLWVLMDVASKEIMRAEYKQYGEAESDNISLSKGNNRWEWVLNDPSMAR